MSLYLVEGYCEDDEVWIGWDAAIGSFFGQVKKAEEEPRHWVGRSLNELESPERLAFLMTGFAEITPQMLIQLQSDKRKEPCKPPSSMP